ncbi:lipopolysaccharide biosynthesis protein [Photobacterium kishitanii]|uniref:lipopolysaccharide biosynthesis protein n=1 Tax=Photobacterium kishitanii TaxID=318456 RepID=UPI000432B992|nr:lipopolysaccharide biosynthesis protein [Photobacterium kishitanii]PSU91369.1 lipopolysaccharide biosynthesis protein [Photobacterium kishitanii]PSU97410.1 lipopolysaccharide biosynthesis protein [Photobacterium kishitanii]PSW68724.1 lipopolysaccharide biosynthesis protein [Photobacterium kishitanii]CEO40020.1 putative Polysaccharide biosynthesis protein [Photobacterium kishitanii]
MNIREFKAFFWSFIDGVGSQGSQLIITIMLARLLTPADFGVIGLISVVVYISNVIGNGGLNSSLIRKAKASDDDFTSVFVFNVTLGVVLYAIVFFSSGFLAHFLNLPQAEIYLKVYALSIIFTAFEQIQRVTLTLDLNFRTQAKITLFSVIFSGVVALVLANYGFGVWALIIQTVVLSSVRCVIFWCVIRWQPKGHFNMRLLLEHLNFGYKLLLGNLVDVAYRYMFNLGIGKFYSVTDLGFYNQATKLTEVPSITITAVVRRVNYPIISKLRNNNKCYFGNLINIASYITSVYLPISLWLSFNSHDVISLLLGERWIGASSFLSILAIAFFIVPLSNLFGNILSVEGRTDLYFKIRLGVKLFLAGLFFLIHSYGIFAVLFFIMFATIFEWLVNIIVSYKYFKFPVFKYFKRLFSIVIPVVISSFLVNNYISIDSTIGNLAVKLIASMIVPACILFLLSKEKV